MARLAETANHLETFTFSGIVGGQDANGLWTALAGGRLPRLSALHMGGSARLTGDDAEVVAGAPWLSSLRDMSVSVWSTGDEQPLQDAPLRELRTRWSVCRDQAVIPGSRTVERLGIRHPDGIGSVLPGLSLPSLHSLSLAGVANHPSLDDQSAQALLDMAPASLRCLWARLDGVNEPVVAALRQRFVVYDGGILGPLRGMSDWTWPGHTWHDETLSVV